MITALINGVKSFASKGAEGLCPTCGESVKAYCGDLQIWHWRHSSLEDCDSFSEGETEWHLNWKKLFPIEFTEVVIKKESVLHRADIKTNYIVIELQNSPISKSEIEKRENFYGKELIWIINGTKFLNRIEFVDSDHIKFLKRYLPYFDSKYHPWTYKTTPSLVFEVTEENSFLIPLLQEFGFQQDFKTGHFWLSLFKIKPREQKTIEEKIDDKIKEVISGRYVKQNPFNIVFDWKSPSKSWFSAKQPVFIDLNDFILQVEKFPEKEDGLIFSYGSGKMHDKSIFINKLINMNSNSNPS